MLKKHINFLLWEYRLVNEPILYKVSFKTNGQNWKSNGNIFDQEIVPRNRLENKPYLYNSTWKTSQELFCDKKSSWEVDPPCQNILRYLSLLILSGFTGAWSGYLGSLGKQDKLLCPFLRILSFIKIFYALHFFFIRT